jgi:hypothetical protein
MHLANACRWKNYKDITKTKNWNIPSRKNNTTKKIEKNKQKEM